MLNKIIAITGHHYRGPGYLDLSSTVYHSLPLRKKVRYIESYLKTNKNNHFNLGALRELTFLCIDAGLYKKAIKYGQKASGRIHNQELFKQVLAMRDPKNKAKVIQDMITDICRGFI
jgi:hypothetical protein